MYFIYTLNVLVFHFWWGIYIKYTVHSFWSTNKNYGSSVTGIVAIFFDGCAPQKIVLCQSPQSIHNSTEPFKCKVYLIAIQLISQNDITYLSRKCGSFLAVSGELWGLDSGLLEWSEAFIKLSGIFNDETGLPSVDSVTSVTFCRQSEGIMNNKVNIHIMGAIEHGRALIDSIVHMRLYKKWLYYHNYYIFMKYTIWIMKLNHTIPIIWITDDLFKTLHTERVSFKAPRTSLARRD